MPETKETKTKVEEKNTDTKPKTRCISSAALSNADQIDIFKRLPLPKDIKKKLIESYIKTNKHKL